MRTGNFRTLKYVAWHKSTFYSYDDIIYKEIVQMTEERSSITQAILQRDRQ